MIDVERGSVRRICGVSASSRSSEQRMPSATVMTSSASARSGATCFSSQRGWAQSSESSPVTKSPWAMPRARLRAR